MPQRAAAARAAAALNTAAPSPADRADPAALYGRRVRKLFGHLGWFEGTVVSSRAEASVKTRFFLIRYDDGDREELDKRTLLPLLLPEGAAAPPHAAAAGAYSDSDADADADAAAEPPPGPADVAEYAVLEALQALQALEYRLPSKRNVAEYALGTLPDALRAAARGLSAMDPPLQRVVARGWAAVADGKLYAATVRFRFVCPSNSVCLTRLRYSLRRRPRA